MPMLAVLLLLVATAMVLAGIAGAIGGSMLLALGDYQHLDRVAGTAGLCGGMAMFIAGLCIIGDLMR